MRSTPTLAAIVEPLLSWYEQNRRSLPWRDDPTPYHVWLSEIMLQQTRIEAVIPYYERFLKELPSIEALSLVEDSRLMKLWEGLGYYSRARNLKKAALVIMQQHGGVMPSSYEELLVLPGVGGYTAGAIASIAFGAPEPAVDGNVLRVITRLTADERDITKQSTKNSITEVLRAIYPRTPDAAAAMTQALMELGETVCLPNGAPLCDKCPLGASCPAREQGLTDHIPYRSPKKPRRIEKKTVLLLLHQDKVALCQRPPKGLLASLWEFPALPGHMTPEELSAHLSTQGISPQHLYHAANSTHIFTHIEWLMQGYFVRLSEPLPDWQGTPLHYVTPEQLAADYALPTAFRAFVRALNALKTDESLS